MAGDAWRKSSPELVERFEAATAGIDGLERRQMFGYPAGFVGGNMVTGLHQESWIVRLPEEERTPRLDAGWTTFEPMAGRPMREYLDPPRRDRDRPGRGTRDGGAGRRLRAHAAAQGAEAAEDDLARPVTLERHRVGARWPRSRAAADARTYCVVRRL